MESNTSAPVGGASESASTENTPASQTEASSASEKKTFSADQLSASGTASFAQEIEEREPVTVTLQELLKAGAHYGHQTRRWNPKMLPFIFGERNGVHIINLDETMKAWTKASKFLSDIASRGGEVLFVGTKQQCRDLVKTEAVRCGAFHITTRWLGGTLSNFETIKRSIARMKKLEDLLKKALDENSEVKLAKKERLGITRELEKLEANLGGIRHMRKLPDALFILDINKESIAVAEARKLHIPVVALVDTNCDPNPIDIPIPSNDDAIKTIRLFVAAASDIISNGKSGFLRRQEDLRAQVRAAEEETQRLKQERSQAEAKNGDGAKKQGDAAEEAAPTEAPASGS